MGFLQDINTLGNFFRGGKDQYTQTTNFQTTNTYLGKQEQYVDCGMSNLFNLYDTTPQLKAVIDRKAAMLSNGCWRHKRIVGSKIEFVEKSPYVNILKNPNARQSGNQFITQLSMLYDIYGQEFTYMNRGFSSAVPSAIWALPSDKVIINRTVKIWKQAKAKDIISSYQLITDGEGTRETFDTNEIIQLNRVNPNDPISGISPIVSLKMPISNVRAAYGSMNRIVSADGALGILSSDVKEGAGMPLTVDEQTRLNKGYKKSFGMQTGKSDILMSQASLRYQHLAFPIKDLMLFENIDSNFKIIIDSFGMNENIFSRQNSSKFSNLQQGLKLAYQDCIIPFAEDISLAFTKGFNMPENEYLELDYSHLSILKVDESEKAKVHKMKAETIKILSELNRNDLIDLVEF